MAKQAKSKTQMLINYVPGEECRIAIVEDGKLEEFTSEKFATQSRVGNIYVGKVINVEPAIQAAFVDFGVGDNGFLHISDLHPRYFPGEEADATEKVGHKTPRRERPLIQAALRRGDEIIVQVLKEGVGTKGPTLTSYLSIPGRFLVMMPQMDKVGVSRKVEDEEQRRKMREILDQLDLPDGFGFILRTAGMDRTKLELKRDLAYLVRLYKDMESRRAKGDKPRLLYAESDLLVRALRDQLTTDVDEIVIDNEEAVQRARRFLKIVAPRTSTRLLHYPGQTPIYHSFAIEEQIAHIHAREVPLPSGGRLVIDQTEALVAIDVNSGKSRDSRDAEENAFQTNLEAVDEICRQLRLRDQGGIVVNDLIDMRHLSHRKEVEARFKERLKRDRARTTVGLISQFGILEMTRQRMRASAESVHFSDCPTCRGRGLVQKPESVTGDALRELAALLDVDKVGRVEIVVSARVAGELLSTKRHMLSRIERSSGKRVDVRVSEALPLDRVTFYAYDAMGADIDLTQPLPRKRPSELIVVEEPADDHDDSISSDAVAERDAADQEDTELSAPREEVTEIGDVDPELLSDEELDQQIRADAQAAAASTAEAGEIGGRRRGRRGRGRDSGRGGRGGRDGARPAQGGRDGARTGERDGNRDGGRDGGRGGQRGPGRGQGGPAQGPAQPAVPRAAGPVADVRRVETQRGVIIMGDHGDDDLPGVAPAAPGGEQNGSGDHGDEHPNQGVEAHAGHEGEFVEGGPEANANGDPNGPPGEGGRRRRRRRRGRGRGRGGAPGMDGAPVGSAGPEGANEGAALNAGDGGGAPSDEIAGSDGDAEGGTNEQGPEGAPVEGGPQGEGGEGGRRRRRRRRGRGRGRGGEGAPADGAAPVANAGGGGGGGGQRPPQQQGGNRDGGRGGNRDGGRGGQRFNDRGERPRNEPRTSQGGHGGNTGGGNSGGNPSGGAGNGPAPQGNNAPKPRLLFASRRKLTPGELNKRPKPE
ncbi:MAG TPA: Rne/Rng family ribonuclease [Phycisphaerales bacterium]